MLIALRLDVEEADILCPPADPDQRSDGDEETVLEEETLPSSPSKAASDGPDSRFQTFRRNVTSWAGKWTYAASHRSTPTGYRKPIPFDNVLFDSLDSKISVGPGTRNRGEVNKGHDHAHMSVAPDFDAELVHPDDRPITHSPVWKVVVPHHPLRPWEDILPYQRSRGYSDQPAYTDDYDDFLWLPRDPLSTLDLDDSVEMRLALTTSAGGSGRLGDWPPINDDDEIPPEPEVVPEGLQVVRRSVSPEHAEHAERSGDGYATSSPHAASDRPLVPDDAVDAVVHDTAEHGLPAIIGSEVQEAGAAIFKRGSVRIQDSLAGLFNRPRKGTGVSTSSHASGEAITMRRMSASTTGSRVTQAAGSDGIHPAESEPRTEEILGDEGAGKVPSTETPLGAPQAVQAPMSGSHISFATLGRSPRPRPSRAHSKASERSSLRLPRTPSIHTQRSVSALSIESRTAVVNRNQSQRKSQSAMSETQKMMLEEVMQEERKYREETRKNEMEEEGREREEMRKGREREKEARERQARVASGTGTGTAARTEGGRGEENGARGSEMGSGTPSRGGEESKEELKLEGDKLEADRPRPKSRSSTRSLSRSRSRSEQLGETRGVGESEGPRQLENVSATGHEAA